MQVCSMSYESTNNQHEHVSNQTVTSKARNPLLSYMLKQNTDAYLVSSTQVSGVARVTGAPSIHHFALLPIFPKTNCQSNLKFSCHESIVMKFCHNKMCRS